MRYWKRMDQNGKTTTVENYSHDDIVKGAVEISEQEFNAFIAGLPAPVPQPMRNLGAEIDNLTKRVEQLETGR